MFKKVNILDEKEKILHEISDEVEGKLSDKEIDLIKRSLKQLRFSQIEELSLKYNLRPGMGLAFPQLGIKKRVIMICHEEEPGKFNDYVVINPKIVSNSTEMIAADTGEGCLSVNREVEGHVPRFARVTIEGYDIEGNKIRIRAREELAIAFQHEIDHLNGILFYERIDKNKPFYTESEMRLIWKKDWLNYFF